MRTIRLHNLALICSLALSAFVHAQSRNHSAAAVQASAPPQAAAPAQSSPSAQGQPSTIYKCTVNGKLVYSNSPCSPDAKPAQLRGSVTTLNKEAFVGKAEAAKPGGSERKTILGITPPDPVADCHKKGGKINREFRACELPLQ